MQTRLWAAIGAKPSRVFYCNGGLGDELMLTAIAAAARADGRPLDLIVAYPDVWRGNTDPASMHTGVDRWHYAKRRGWIGTEIVHLGYLTGRPGHIAEQMAARAGIALPPGWRPVIHGERAPARDRARIVLQNSCRGARYAATTKEWPQERWRELVRRLSPDFQLVQVGIPADPALPDVDDRRGRTSLHDVYHLLSGAGAFVGLESGLQHVAAAARTPSVIIFGGRSLPSWTGYAFNRNLTRQPACVGCGLNAGCPHGMVCMDISVDEVEAAVRAAVAESSAAGSASAPLRPERAATT